MTKLDHILWGTRALSECEELFKSLCGLTLSGGGAHPGFGTHNTLASLGGGRYFEAIAPDPAQTQRSPRAQQLAAFSQPRLMTFAVAGRDLEGYAARVRQAGIDTSDIIEMSRTRPDGVTLSWRLVYPSSRKWGDHIPFMIDWGNSEHPSLTAPHGCQLDEFVAIHPEAHQLREIYAALAIPVQVSGGTQPGFMARLQTPNGSVVLT